jgi:hypothetical protein
VIHIQNLKSILDKAFGEVGTERNTDDVKYHCKAHGCNHSKQKLEVNLVSGQYHCWVCGFKGGGIPNLIRKVGGSDVLVKSAQAIVGESEKRIKVENAPDFFGNVTNKDKTEQLELPIDFNYLRNKRDNRAWRACYNYAKRRKFTDIQIYRYNMGYVDDSELKDRLIVPSYDSEGKLNYYSARSFFDDSFLKYINATVKSRDLIGFEHLIDFKQPINLVEGALDAITLGMNTIPLFGKSIPNKLKQRIIQEDTPEIRIILDDDAFADAIRLSERMIKLGKNVKLVKLDGKDPNVLGKFKTMEIIDNTKKLDFFDLISYKIK